ncbi:GULP1 family protein [Megaselia abdita]
MSTTLKFWNKQNNNSNNSNSSNGSNTTNGTQSNDSKNGKRNWLHSPESLINGHVVYLVKFLGNTIVDQPKGIDVVKDAIRKLQFAQQMTKAETGHQQKLKKVEITVSIDGVAVQEPRTQKILHQYPLHNISYCADEKGVKKFFTFIAKNIPKQQQNGSAGTTAIVNGHMNGGTTQPQPADGEESHECFVFVSSKLASDITLTIGQAFDLAYKRYMSDTGKTIESTKAQEQNQVLEKQIAVYKRRLREVADLLQKPDLDKILSKLKIRDLLELPVENNVVLENGNNKLENNSEQMLIDTVVGNINNKSYMPAVPPRNNNQITLDAFKSGGQKMDELLLNSDSDSDFDPRAEENDSSSGSGINGNINGNKITNDFFGFEPQQYSFSANTSVNRVNGVNGISSNISSNAPPTIPPPLLAPPPKAGTPRRSNNNSISNDLNGNEDLFGSTPFSDKPNTLFNDSTNGFNDQPLHNPFNESGIDMNHSRILSVMSEVNTLAQNINQIDSILNKTQPNHIDSVLEDSTTSVFDTTTTSTTGKSPTKGKDGKGVTNPFAKKPETYNTLRNSPENIEENNGTTTSSSTKKSLSYDIFKEAASAAFSELNFGGKTAKYSKNKFIGNDDLDNEDDDDDDFVAGGDNDGVSVMKTSNKKSSFFSSSTSNSNTFLNGTTVPPPVPATTKHASKNLEFSNQISGVFVNSSNGNFNNNLFGSNFNQKKMIDDFSLESLDPLRK